MTQVDDPLFLFYFRKLERWKPRLIQEELANNPWGLVVAVILLNKTTGKAAIPVFRYIMKEWPTPYHLSNADPGLLKSTIAPLGLQTVRAERLIKLSTMCLLDPPIEYEYRPSRHRVKDTNPRKSQLYPPTPISHLPGAGPYALDSYRIFCESYFHPDAEEWKRVIPSDKELAKYLRWRWAFMEQVEWTPSVGVVGPLTLPCLRSLLADLSGEKQE